MLVIAKGTRMLVRDGKGRQMLVRDGKGTKMMVRRRLLKIEVYNNKRSYITQPPHILLNIEWKEMLAS